MRLVPVSSLSTAQVRFASVPNMEYPASGSERSDGGFDVLAEHIAQVVAQVRAALASGEERSYFPTVTFITDKSVDISVLTGGAASSESTLKMFESFGYKAGRRKRAPDFVFVAAESLRKDGGEQIMISGCSKGSSLVIGYLGVVRSPQGKIQTGVWSGARAVPVNEALRLPAYRVMRGLIAKSRAPWWKIWMGKADR